MSAIRSNELTYEEWSYRGATVAHLVALTWQDSGANSKPVGRTPFGRSESCHIGISRVWHIDHIVFGQSGIYHSIRVSLRGPGVAQYHKQCLSSTRFAYRRITSHYVKLNIRHHKKFICSMGNKLVIINLLLRLKIGTEVRARPLCALNYRAISIAF